MKSGDREGEGGRNTTQLYKAICGLAINIPKTDLHRTRKAVNIASFIRCKSLHVNLQQYRNFLLDSR